MEGRRMTTPAIDRKTMERQGMNNSSPAVAVPIDPAQPSPPATDIVDALLERTTLRYMGDCKCGHCQLVHIDLLFAAIAEIKRLRAPRKLWLWRNGEREFWAFAHKYPIHMGNNGDPQTIGQPCGYALLKPSRPAPNRPEIDGIDEGAPA
jgi:hypothetical protein